MRVKLQNKTGLPQYQYEVRAICEWVARHFPMVKGKVNTILKKAKYGTDYGSCWRSRKLVKVFVNFTDGAPTYPSTVTERRYFKHAKGNPNPYTLNNWQESLVHVLSHEFFHMTPADRNMRRSRQELHAENKGTKNLEEFRTQEAQHEIQARIFELKERADKKIVVQVVDNTTSEKKMLRISATEFKKSPEYQIQKRTKEIEKLERKIKRLTKAMKKKQISLKYYQKKAETSNITV